MPIIFQYGSGSVKGSVKGSVYIFSDLEYLGKNNNNTNV